MAREARISDESLTQALGFYAGMVDHVLDDPERWLGDDEDPPPGAGRVRRGLDSIRDRAFGEVTPASPEWVDQPVERRVDWWVDRIGVSAGLAAAAPRFAGALSDRVPLQAALGASASGLAVCAVAREHGVGTAAEWVPLLARVLFDRDLPADVDAVPSGDHAERELETALADPAEPPSGLEKLGRGAQRGVRTLWRLARTFLDLQQLLDQRPRGGLLARSIAKLPVVGVAGGWLDERSAIRKAAAETATLLT